MATDAHRGAVPQSLLLDAAHRLLRWSTYSDRMVANTPFPPDAADVRLVAEAVLGMEARSANTAETRASGDSCASLGGGKASRQSGHASGYPAGSERELEARGPLALSPEAHSADAEMRAGSERSRLPRYVVLCDLDDPDIAPCGLVVERGVTRGARMHGARHTAAQRILDATGNLKAAQVALGHSSMATTSDVYVDQNDAQRLDAMRAAVGGSGLDATLLTHAGRSV